MPKVLVSNNSELLRHLRATSFRRLELDLSVASSGDEALAMAARAKPDLAILDAELPGISGYEVTHQLKILRPLCKVVLVLGKRISAQQMHSVAESGCDEVVIAPMSTDELYDIVAIQLELPRPGAERFTVDVAVMGGGRTQPLEVQVTNLSVDGARLVVADPLPMTICEDTQLQLSIRPEHEGTAPVVIRAHVVWAHQGAGETVIGAAFNGLSADARQRLSELTQWEVVEETERARIVIKGDITEATNFNALLSKMVGRVDFDLSQVRYMNSLGVREWVEFLREANSQGYEFHACSPAFVLQASMVLGVLGRGTVASFFAPYHCEDCDHQEEKLLQSAAILATNYQPPPFTCPMCAGQMTLDDIPERYFAFLMPDPPA